MREKTEKVNIMDNNYGRSEIPEIILPKKTIQKYWGKIKTVYENSELVVKHIEMNKGTQSSMEYHLKKDEYYYLVKGKLKIGMRIGRAKNVSKILEEGQIYHIPRGLMHMRIALEDCIIVEWSNSDDDSDSNIVEDGKTYIHKEL